MSSGRPQITLAIFILSSSTLLYELLLTRLFSVVLFAPQAHLAIALALLGIGVGAVLEHLNQVRNGGKKITRGSLSLLVCLFALASVIAVFLSVEIPLTSQSDLPPASYGERSSNLYVVVNTWYLSLLLLVLSLPFVITGVVTSRIFKEYKEYSSWFYAFDLVGGALSALFFIVLLKTFPAPDLVFVISCLCGLASLVLSFGTCLRTVRALSLLLVIISALGLFMAATKNGVLKIKYAAGYSENTVVYSQWTPLTRISVFKNPRNSSEAILLDNASASLIVQTEKQLRDMQRAAARALVYELVKPSGHVAVIGASAGPELAVAQSKGFSDIEAIDVAGEIFDIVGTRYKDSTFNPFGRVGLVKVNSDGRAAISHSNRSYDVIQIVHTNLWSEAGLVSNVWSPSLLETTEAFETYLEKLSDEGVFSFGKGGDTLKAVPSIKEALRRRGIEDYWRHIALIEGGSTVLLLRKRPWAEDEISRLKTILASGNYGPNNFLIDPSTKPNEQLYWFLSTSGFVVTDDRPYIDMYFRQFVDYLHGQIPPVFGGVPISNAPLAYVYSVFIVQCVFVSLTGAVFLLVPAFIGVRGFRGKKWPFLSYAALLGFGYMTIETVLIYKLVLFVGHPIYAITIVLFTMLLFSGLGSFYSGTSYFSQGKSLRFVIFVLVLMGAFDAFVTPALLAEYCQGMAFPIRIIITFFIVAPLGFFMGMPFPLALRLIPTSSSCLVPWAWALNAWTSVLAAFVTVLVSRFWGYSYGLCLALGCYLLCAFLVGFFPVPINQAKQVNET